MNEDKRTKILYVLKSYNEDATLPYFNPVACKFTKDIMEVPTYDKPVEAMSAYLHALYDAAVIDPTEVLSLAQCPVFALCIREEVVVTTTRRRLPLNG